MADSGSQAAGPNLPQFDDKKVYLVAGKSLNAIIQAVQANRPKAVQDGGLKIVSQSDQGTFLAASGGTIELTVCINGSPVTKKFLLA
jgi:hypothetical protein